jgi:DNA-binding transcriptional regulator Cro
MKKSEAIDLFGGIVDAAVALGVSRQAIEKWPDPLPLRISDRVLGAAARNQLITVRPRTRAARAWEPVKPVER